MRRQSHIIRDAVVAVGAVLALVVAAAVLESAALATVVVMLVLGMVVVVFPFVVIHFDEHEERLRHHGPRARR